MVVTPTVMDRDLIRLQIVPEFSAIDGANSVNGIPGTTVKRVQTTVELREGQTLALGGLISRQTTTTVSRIPLLGDLPFVGSRLFQSKNSREDEVELLVLVTPEIVRPMEPDEVPPLPNYYITHPNDQDLYKYGRSEGNPDTTVYKTQPFGAGGNHGMSAGYSLPGANAVSGFSQPAMPPTSPVVVPPSTEIQMPVRHFSGSPGSPQPTMRNLAPHGYSPPPTLPPPQLGPQPGSSEPSSQRLLTTPALPISSSSSSAPQASVRASTISRITSAFRKQPKLVDQARLKPVATESRR